ncbi:hypothetical protein L9F63_006003 [Diploptera punctata]|uniref:Uncharacterized protein n=1 Tax=Diploptera punctata TaxID=6984 RepID=A0AAD7ZBT7_DIPPU|nr:hypothetical protein L9F63_006003 [Diploptera punctata]
MEKFAVFVCVCTVAILSITSAINDNPCYFMKCEREERCVNRICEECLFPPRCQYCGYCVEEYNPLNYEDTTITTEPTEIITDNVTVTEYSTSFSTEITTSYSNTTRNSTNT